MLKLSIELFDGTRLESVGTILITNDASNDLHPVMGNYRVVVNDKMHHDYQTTIKDVTRSPSVYRFLMELFSILQVKDDIAIEEALNDGT